MDAIAPITTGNFLNIVLGSLGLVITIGLVPLALEYLRGMIAERKLKNALLQKQYQDAIDSGAQKAIGGALAKIAIPEGKLPDAMRVGVTADAAAVLAKNFPDSFKALGVVDIPAKAEEIIKSRLGLMDAVAAGNPVPNPSQNVALTTDPKAN